MIINKSFTSQHKNVTISPKKADFASQKFSSENINQANISFTASFKAFVKKLFSGDKTNEKQYDCLKLLNSDSFSFDQSIIDTNKDFCDHFSKTLSAMSGYIKGYLDQGHITEEKAQKICVAANKCLSIIVNKVNLNKLTFEEFNKYLNKDIEACMVLAHSNGIKHLNYLLIDLESEYF